MAAQDGVDAADPAGHLQVHIHAVVGQHHDHLRTLGTSFVHDQLHVVILDAEAPVRNHVSRIGNRRVGECLADDRDRNAIDMLDHVGLENLVAEIVGLDVLRNEIHFTLEIVVHDLFDPLRTQRKLPVTCHHVDAQQFAGVHHVLSLGPQCSG